MDGRLSIVIAVILCFAVCIGCVRCTAVSAARKTEKQQERALEQSENPVYNLKEVQLSEEPDKFVDDKIYTVLDVREVSDNYNQSVVVIIADEDNNRYIVGATNSMSDYSNSFKKLRVLAPGDKVKYVGNNDLYLLTDEDLTNTGGN